MKQISRGDDTEIIRRTSVASGSVDPELVPGAEHRSSEKEEAEVAHLNKVAKYARGLTVFMTIALLVLWPMPLYGTSYVFSKKFFTGKPSAHCKITEFDRLTFVQAGSSLESCGSSAAP